MNAKFDVLVIGGGFTGTMVAVELLRRSPSVKVGIIDKGVTAGCGVAYSTPYRAHLLNVPAGNMSALADDPDHFYRWARENYNPEIQRRSFLPRILYGRYIGSLLEEAMAQGTPERCQRLQDEAVSLTINGATPTVACKNGIEVAAHKVVFATGNFPPTNPRVKGLDDESITRYVRFAWSETALEGLRARGSVLLIGSGLTGLDQGIALKARGFRGTIHLVSRRGLVSQRHQPANEWPQFWGRRSPRTTLGLLRLVREQVRMAEASGSNWRAVIDALRPVTQEIWQSLPLPERKRFVRHVRPYWEAHRHRIAPEIGDIIADMVEEGQVKVHAGRLLYYEEDPHGVNVTFRERRTGQLKVLRVDRVINCTGPETDCRRIDSPLLAGLVDSGLARPDALGLGLDVNGNGALVSRGGDASRCLYTVGPARKGRLWETTAVPEIRIQVAALACHLAEVVGRRRQAGFNTTESPEARTEDTPVLGL